MAQFYFGRKTQNITAKVTESQKDTITEAAKKEGLSVSEFLMLALEFYFDKHGVESTHSPSEIALEQPITEGMADSKEGEDNSLDGEVFKYMKTDLDFYQEAVDSGERSSLFKAIRAYRDDIREGLSSTEDDIAREEERKLISHYEVPRD